MASSPVKFLFAFFFVSAVGWIIFTFASRLLAWFLSRIFGASVAFRVTGCNCLRDVNLKFKKGTIYSVSIGEIKLSLRRSLVNLGFSFISRDPKLQLLISDIEIVVRSSASSKERSATQRTRGTSRTKWMLLINVARLLSISVNELVFKVPKTSFEVKDLRVEMSKSGGSTPVLNIKLYLIPLHVQTWDSSTSFEKISFDQWECSTSVENNCAPFICEDMSLASDLYHDKELGIQIKNLDMRCGDITVNLTESLFNKTKLKSDVYSEAVPNGGPGFDPALAKDSQKNNLSSLLKKQIILFPDKVNFRLPKLSLRFVHRNQRLLAESNVMGILLRSIKSQVVEDSGDMTSHFDIQTDMTEIHILEEDGSSILEILKIVLTASADVPMQLPHPIRSEIDIKLGGTQCNLILNRLKPWFNLDFSKKKDIAVNNELRKCPANKTAAIMWTFTVSAPEMIVVLYNLNDVPLYYGCSQSSHLFANNIASKGVQAHAELGEVHIYMADEYQKCLKLDLFDVEGKFGSLMHMARVSLDWGLREMEAHDQQDSNSLKLVFAIDITGMGLSFYLRHIESLILTLTSFKSFFKTLLIPRKRDLHDKAGHTKKATAKGTRILKLKLEKCIIKYCGEVSMNDMDIADPKRVNFGSQGGVVVINVSADGTERRANIISNTSSGCNKLKFFTSLSISHLDVCLNKERRSLQVDLERARCIYQENSCDHLAGSKVTIFDVQQAKFVRRSGGLSDVAVCSLLNVTDILIRWEPDVHLAVFEVLTSVKYFLYKMKDPSFNDGTKEKLQSLKDKQMEKDVAMAQAKSYRNHSRREEVYAIDVEKLKFTAEISDGVETVVHVQSIFSENAKIGMLLEEFVLSLNNAKVFRSSRMQISRIPVPSSCNSTDTKVQLMSSWDTSSWDWVIQGPDLHICMPYRLQLRAIEDAVEDMLRGLKLIVDAKTNLMLPIKKNGSWKSKSKSTNFGTVRFIIRKLTADIEEEPMQGWLDEHYQLMRTEICEASVRAKFLDDILEKGRNSGGSEPKELCSERKFIHHGVEIDISNDQAVQNLYEEIQKQAFRMYYRACKKLVSSEGSGACSKGFQAGFNASKNRCSLLSLCATELDVTLTKIVGGEDAMVDFVKQMDPASLDNDIPFSRTYGRNVDIISGSLVFKLRNYTFPLFSATDGKCKGRIVLAQQATSFQPQIEQDVYIGKWWKVRMLRSASGTTPPMKMYSDLPIYFNKAELSFGVGYEPSFADISYAFTVALRRANLGSRSWASSTANDQNVSAINSPKKERSLPWWDDMRYYIHGKICLFFMESRWNLLATTNPYEKLDELKIVSAYMEIQQTDGRIFFLSKDFKIYLSSLESLVKNSSLKLPSASVPFLHSPGFSLDVTMDWDCESGCPLNHYLHALPKEREPRKKVFDPFRSTSLSLRWNFSLRPSLQCYDKFTPSSAATNDLLLDESMHDSLQTMKNTATNSPTMNIGAHDLAWLFKWWSLNYSPPHKLRSFSRWPRFGIVKTVRSGNLSLDKVMTEFCLRLDATPSCIRYRPLSEDDPASGLTFEMSRLKYELCYSRGKQLYTFDCKRELLDLVYQGLDLHLLKAFLCTSNKQDVQSSKGASLMPSIDSLGNENFTYPGDSSGKNGDDGFLLFSDYFTIRRQAPKADPARLLAWQEAGRRNLEMTYVRSEFENGSESDHTRSDPSDDDGFNVVIADNCRRVFVYGLKLLWTIENRDAVWSWVGGISKAFEPPKPSPSRQYAQRKLLEDQQRNDGHEVLREDNYRSSAIHGLNSPSSQHVEVLGSVSSVSISAKMDSTTYNEVVNHGCIGDFEEDGTRHFMVNVIQPQFNLHSEEANGRFLLAAASGRVLARSFHSILHVGYEMIEQALGTTSASFPDMEPEMTWKRAELSVMLEHVQAHVAPTDVDPGAGLQWLPKILRSSPKVKRTGALLERVFMPCQMYFRYTRHKGGTAELKVKPLKELIFNSPNITATMTSRQFQVMLDVLSSLLFARLPKPRKSSLSYPADDDDDVEEEADEVVPDGVEEVELARIQLEQKERERKMFLDDIRTLVSSDVGDDLNLFTDSSSDLWMVSCGKLRLIRGLRKELCNAQKSRKEASSALRMALQKAAQLRLMEKEKNKSPSCAMRISMRINKVVWSMLADGKSFAEAEINDMIYDFDRDYKDIGVAQFTTKSFVVRNCLLNAKSDMLLSAWNAPPEWGKNVMLRVNARQGAPKDGSSPLELFQVEIYPLKIHLTETMYRMMWGYFFPEEDQDSQRRQEVWKVSTTAGSRRVKKSASTAHHEAGASRENEAVASAAGRSLTLGPGGSADSSQASKFQSLKANIVCGANPELRRAGPLDEADETRIESSASGELLAGGYSKSGLLNPAIESQQAAAEDCSNRGGRSKDQKPLKSGRLSNEEKKVGKAHDEKRARSRRMMEFHNIKISQVELLVTYEGSRFAVNDLRLLMDTFHRDEFTGTWRRLFSRVKKHIIWGVLKSVTGMQGKKFKDKGGSQREGMPESDLNFSDSDGGQSGKLDQFPVSWLKRPSDGAGDGFVTSIKGLFNSQRRKAKAFVLRTMRGEAESEFNSGGGGDRSESDTEYPFARQLTITKAKKLIRRHTRKFRSRAQKNSGTALQIRESHPSTPKDLTPLQSDSSSGSFYEDFHD